MHIPQARIRSGLFSVPLWRSTGQIFLDLIFPPRCVHCGRVDWHFCNSCQRELENTPVLPDMLSEVLPLVQVASTGLHQGVLQSAVQGLKYYGQRELASVLAQRMATLLESFNWTYDLIIPVPIHSQRLRERGYNQAQEISESLAQILSKEHSDSAIKRERATQSQVGLSAEQRRENVEEAFSARADIIEGKTLLLVDDVKTTGATMAACAKAALSVGAQQIYGITATVAAST